MEEVTVETMDELVRLMPSAAVPSSYFFDEMTVTNSQTGERQRRVVLSFVTPIGVNKFWFEGEALVRFATLALATGQAAQKPVLQVATTVADELLVAKEILGGD